VCVDNGYRRAVIIPLMGMKQRRGDQSHHHRDHTETCAEPLHVQDSVARSMGSQRKFGAGGIECQTTRTPQRFLRRNFESSLTPEFIAAA
jgi:hypothetical protein